MTPHQNRNVASLGTHLLQTNYVRNVLVLYDPTCVGLKYKDSPTVRDRRGKNILYRWAKSSSRTYENPPYPFRRMKKRKTDREE